MSEFNLKGFREEFLQSDGWQVSDCYKPHDDKFLRRDAQDAYEGAKWAWQSQQDKIDELQARVDDLEKQLVIVLDEYYMEGRFSTRICNEAEKVLDKEDRLNDSWYVKHVKPYSE